jgi:hypothetical protein
MRLTSDPDKEMLELKAKHLATSMWLIALILPSIVTIPALVGGKWQLLGLQMACILAFQTHTILLKRKIKRVNKTLLVREVMES